jgi:hypothetical protein
MTALLVVLLAAMCAGLAGLIAQGKNRDPGPFMVAGLLLGPVGLLIVGFVENGDRVRQRRAAQVEQARAAAAATPWMDADGR